jgi:hypothetical protein
MKNVRWILAIFTALVAGCTVTTPRGDADFGRSHAMLRAQQSVAPSAAGADVSGIDGQAARAAMDNYRKDFRTPAADPNAPPANGAGSQ